MCEAYRMFVGVCSCACSWHWNWEYMANVCCVGRRHTHQKQRWNWKANEKYYDYGIWWKKNPWKSDVVSCEFGAEHKCIFNVALIVESFVRACVSLFLRSMDGICVCRRMRFAFFFFMVVRWFYWKLGDMRCVWSLYGVYCPKFVCANAYASFGCVCVRAFVHPVFFPFREQLLLFHFS